MNFKTLIISSLIVLTIYSCKKSENPSENKPEPTVTSKVDVYTAGSINSKAAYWKNEVLNKVNDDVNGSSAIAIAVQGSDVYLAGTTLSPSDRTATYWKNGVPTYLGKITGDDIKGIAVQGNDVYVIGQTERYINGIQSYSATLWKNGVASYIGSSLTSVANAISITNNGDIYIAGRSDSRACYWKNGSIVYVGDSDRSSAASAICISGTDVYLAGYSSDDVIMGLSRQTPVYWKNGVKTKLPINGTASALNATSIAVNGTNVYVVGVGLFDGSPNAFIKAIYWKNGIFNDISAINESKFSYIANTVAANDGEVYIGVSTNGKAYLLKNGVQTMLNISGATSFDYKAICLVPK